MKALYTSAALLALLFNGAALANDHGDEHADEARVVHYEVETPADETAALALLQNRADAIGEILKKDAPDGNDMEKVHEHTYSLEAAVDKLRESADSDAKEEAVDYVDEAVQALHYGSENHNIDVSREWLAKLTPAVETLETRFKAES
jgi:hypothetical protein